MSRAKPSYTPTPRVFDAYQVATRLNKSETWFHANRADLEAQAFPKRDDFLGGWDADAIERWLDLRSGIVSGADDAPMVTWSV
jgi:hypothetical protein